MRIVDAEVLLDPSYRVPPGPDSPTGVAWLRSKVVRFCDGVDHARRRALLDRVLAGLQVTPGDVPTAAMVTAMALPVDSVLDIALVAGAYQPHAPQSTAADDAADRLVQQCGGRTELSAARVCLLVQAHAGTQAAIALRQAGDTGPAIAHTRRLTGDGEEVLVDLRSAPFGAGPHQCPGQMLALDLVHAAVTDELSGSWTRSTR